MSIQVCLATPPSLLGRKRKFEHYSASPPPPPPFFSASFEPTTRQQQQQQQQQLHLLTNRHNATSTTTTAAAACSFPPTHSTVPTSKRVCRDLTLLFGTGHHGSFPYHKSDYHARRSRESLSDFEYFGLSNELILLVFSFLDAASMLQCAQCSHHTRMLATSDLAWRALFRRDFAAAFTRTQLRIADASWLTAYALQYQRCLQMRDTMQLLQHCGFQPSIAYVVPNAVAPLDSMAVIESPRLLTPSPPHSPPSLSHRVHASSAASSSCVDQSHLCAFERDFQCQLPPAIELLLTHYAPDHRIFSTPCINNSFSFMTFDAINESMRQLSANSVVNLPRHSVPFAISIYDRLQQLATLDTLCINQRPPITRLTIDASAQLLTHASLTEFLRAYLQM
jgi:hypothetical protein